MGLSDEEKEAHRYFLFPYITRWTAGSVKIAHVGMPSELYLKEVAIPSVASHLGPEDNIIISGFFEFKNYEDFENFSGGYTMDDEINKLING